MALVSVTRLRVRSFRFLIPFLIATARSRRQLLKSAGFLEGRMTLEFPRAFWTVTVWDSGESMRGFRNTAAHLRAMPRLLHWCDEGSYAHWEAPAADMPSMEVAYDRLRDSGHVSKVNHPSPAHASGRTTSDARPPSAPTFRPAS